MRLCSDLFQSCFPGTSGTSPNDSIQIKWPILSYRELAKVTNNFDQCNMLEKIGLEKVYHGKTNGREVAIERYSNKEMHIFQQFLYEDLISNILPHKNLVSFHGCAFHHKEFLLAHEYLSNGTLASYLQLGISHSSTLHWLTRLDIAIDAANALSYLHYHGIVHRNVKSRNILLDKNLCAKLGGLHLSRKFPEGVSINDTYVTSDVVGTCGYIDPEYVSHGRVGATVDVYSFGVVLCELISSKLAKYWEGCEEESIATILSKKIRNQDMNKVLDPRLGFQSDHKIKQMIIAVAELALECMSSPQELRPNMEQVLEILNDIKHERFETKSEKGKLKDGREIAVKRFHNETDKSIKQFMKEIEILSLLQHKNLVLLYGCSSRHSKNHLLVYEYISNGTLSKHLQGPSSEKLSWLTRLNIAIETATALVYLHDSGIIHRDVKGSNILLDENLTVKVADFGLSRSLPSSVTHVSTIPVGTHAYIDPDYYESGRVSDRSDVYSFGVVLFELISSKPPSLLDDGESVTLAKFGITKMLNNAMEELVDPIFRFGSDQKLMEMIAAVAELAFQCVQCPKDLRPSMKQVLETLEGIKKGTWGFNQIT
ncbi:LEAF RUST 10 DISEASE-RESISTANCE LOCUS RECEPTOR-LIKE PROTEIN KINASE-like 1.3 [Arachis duranensis]|uniref:non-specific serine/threonine protein kinase n=1 Tax=Arachis duranensis TaxID=130453 RepID=A0A6P5NCD7_ARADU|nr:LEAF RUST 10 DISEASE-RESISTANCE LOCUS RECEPTOR-LIKE PROTEIN KINASE-like 1.3 [Arachis duranensis]